MWSTWAPGNGKRVSSSLKSDDVVKVEKREEKHLTCYNCGGKGHAFRQCPSEAFFGTIGRSVFIVEVRPPFCCEWFVEGRYCFG